MAEQERKVFDPRVVAALLVAGLLAFAAFVVLLAYAGDIGGGRDSRAHALSSSAVGFKGLLDLIEHGGGTRVLIRARDELETEDLVVAMVEPSTDRKALEELIEARGPRPTLIVLPKWSTIADPRRQSWVRSRGWLPPFVYEGALQAVGAKIALRRAPEGAAAGQGPAEGLTIKLPNPVQTVSGAKLTAVIATKEGGIVLGRVGDRPLYVLADPDLLNNKGLKDPARARAALAMLEALNATDAGAVWFDLSINGFGESPNLLKLMFEPPFAALTAAILLAALLAGLHGANRFGAPQRDARAIALGKAALVENSAALFRIAKREQAAGPAYVEAVREAAARESGAHLALAEHELDAYLDRISPPSGPKFSALAERAAEAGDRFALLAAARALFQWKRGLIK